MFARTFRQNWPNLYVDGITGGNANDLVGVVSNPRLVRENCPQHILIGGNLLRDEVLPLPCSGPLECSDELHQTDAKRPAEGPQLDHINPALTPFAFAYEGLAFPYPLRQLHLGEAGPNPGLPKSLQERAVLGRVDGFLHCVVERNGSKLRG